MWEFVFKIIPIKKKKVEEEEEEELREKEDRAGKFRPFFLPNEAIDSSDNFRRGPGKLSNGKTNRAKVDSLTNEPETFGKVNYFRISHSSNKHSFVLSEKFFPFFF